MTVQEILDYTKDCDDNLLFLNSNFTVKGTSEYLLNKYYDPFQPIVDFYEDNDVTVYFSCLDKLTSGKSLDYFRQFVEKLKNKDVEIERDIEDGFIYAPYENICINDKYIILC